MKKKFYSNNSKRCSIDAKNKLEMIIKFDILILDIMMPGESGLIFNKRNKKNNSTTYYTFNSKRVILEDRIHGIRIWC